MISVIIPCFNEEKTIDLILKKVQSNININDQIIVVDDCSTDNSVEILNKLKVNYPNLQCIFHKKNKGKGAAIKSAKALCNGDIVIIQDADLEYDPNDYSKLITPILKNEAKVVYGSRVLNQSRYLNKNFTSKFRVFGNHLLTIISNLINNQKLTDAHTCYKVFDKNVFELINLEEDDFAFCPEVTSKISKMGINILEVPINYNGRGYSEGKKIKFIDAFKALKAIIKYGL